MSRERALYLSYHSGDAPAVASMREYLAAGEGWQCRERLSRTQLWSALQNDLAAVLVFIGPAGLDEPQRRDIGLALARQAEAGPNFPVIPVRLPGGSLAPAFLFDQAWIDLTADTGLARLGPALRERPRRPIAAIVDLCPFPGPRPFHEEEAAFFFGREEFTSRLVQALRAWPVVTVVGAAGSGKSSVVQAGLLPRLRRQVPPAPAWEVVLCTPGHCPFERLAAALLPWLAPEVPPAERPAAIHRLRQNLAGGQVCLADLIATRLAGVPEPDHCLLVLDQFEELLILAPPAERRPFIAALLEAATLPCFSLLFCLQAEFYSQAMDLDAGLSRHLEQHTLHLEPLSPAGLEQAITGPVRPVTLAYEPGLPARIQEETRFLSMPLPRLQAALVGLWRQHNGGLLRHAAYDRLGGLAGALDYQAELAFSTLTAPQQARAADIFTRLAAVELRGGAMARPVTLAELSPGLAVREAVQARATVQALIAGELLRLEPDPAGDEPAFVLAAPALLVHWRRLSGWLDTRREFLLWRERLQPALAGWEQAGRGETGLLEGPALDRAGRWLAAQPGWLEAAERAYVRQSLAHQGRQRDMRRVKWLAGAVLAVVLAGLGLIQVLGHYGQVAQTLTQVEGELATARAVAATAEVARQDAQTQRQLALGRQLNAQAQELLTQSEPDLVPGVLLALESLRYAPSPEAEQTLRLGLARLPRPQPDAPAHSDPRSVAYQPEGRWLVGRSQLPVPRVWAPLAGQEVLQMSQRGWIMGAVFSPDSRWLATKSRRTVQVWRFDSAPDAPVMLHEAGWLVHESWVNDVAFSPDGRWLATASSDNTARIWQAATGQELARLDQDQAVEAVTFRPAPGGNDDTWLATKSSRTVRVWRLQLSSAGGNLPSMNEIVGWQEMARLTHDNWINTLAFSPDGQLLATASADGTARVWEVTTGQEVARLAHGGEVFSLAFSPDGQFLATASADHTVRLWLTGTVREVARLVLDRPVALLAFSPDGRQLATRSGDTIQVWRLAGGPDEMTGQPVMRLTIEEPVRMLTFSPDSRWLALAAGDPPGGGVAGVWDVATGRAIVETRMGYWLSAALFSPDGRWLITGGGDRIVRVWPLRLKDLVAEACDRLPRNLTEAEWRHYLGNEEAYRATCPNLF